MLRVDLGQLGREGSVDVEAHLASDDELWQDTDLEWVDDVDVRLRASYAGTGEVVVRGKVAGTLHQRCRRCLERVDTELAEELTMVFVADADEDDGGAYPFEPVGEELDLRRAVREELVLVNMDLAASWQRVGVLANITSRFQTFGLSIDMIASSQTHVTVALDPAANHLDPVVMTDLLRELEDVCSPRLDEPATCVSLIGRSIADVLHRLAPLLERLQQENVHLLSHAANDMSLSIVVDHTTSAKLERDLHARMFEELMDHAHLGPTWEHLLAEMKPG